MKYRKNLSILGYGCMRFTRNGTSIDLPKAEKELMYAIEHGVNYLDTAYVYPGNEATVGEILWRNHCREKIFLATKLPHYLIKSRSGIERKFQEQLSRLRTDYIDYYLMHMLNDVNTWERLKKLGILEWIQEKKENGQIRQIGFSFHGNTEHFLELLDAYDWDFCQIQYNYLDETSQAGGKDWSMPEKRNSGYHYGTAQGGRLVADFQEAKKIQTAEDSILRLPRPEMAVESAPGDLRLSGMNSGYDKENLEPRRTKGLFYREDFPWKKWDILAADEGGLYRLRILHALPGRGHSHRLSLLQYAVRGDEKLREEGIPQSYGHAEESHQRLPVHTVRQMRTVLSPVPSDPPDAGGSLPRTGAGFLSSDSLGGARVSYLLKGKQRENKSPAALSC